MIVVIDYGLGNLASIANALNKLGIKNKISSDVKVINQAMGLILPGVGSANQGMKNLKKSGLDDVIAKQVNSGKPLLGICLGMQLLLSSSEEGNVKCLDLVKGKTKKFKTKLKVPEIGWNQVRVNGSKLLKGIKNTSYFYFVNSYYCDPTNKEVVKGVTEYGQRFCSVLEKDNLFGVQFHPEKSGDEGLKLLKNFWEAIC